MSENVSKVGVAIEKMNEQSVMVEIHSLKKKKQNLINEWRKERKTADYDSEEDSKFYKSPIKEIEESIKASQKYLESLRK